MPYCKKCGAELPEGATFCQKCGEQVGTAAQLKLAFWGERFVAWLLDVIILGIIVGVLRLSVWAGWPSLIWPGGFPFFIPFVDIGLSNIVYFLYWMFMDGIYGQSLGKMVMKTKVTRLDGNPINMAQAAIESIGKAFLLPLDIILGLVLYPRKRQRIFNYLSNTIVIRT